MEIDKDKIKVGDAFKVKGFENTYGTVEEIALVREITKQGIIYCVKFSKEHKCVVAKKYELKIDDILQNRIPFMSWFWHQCNPKQQDDIVATLENLGFKY